MNFKKILLTSLIGVASIGGYSSNAYADTTVQPTFNDYYNQYQVSFAPREGIWYGIGVDKYAGGDGEIQGTYYIGHSESEQMQMGNWVVYQDFEMELRGMFKPASADVRMDTRQDGGGTENLITMKSEGAVPAGQDAGVAFSWRVLSDDVFDHTDSGAYHSVGGYSVNFVIADGPNPVTNADGFTVYK